MNKTSFLRRRLVRPASTHFCAAGLVMALLSSPAEADVGIGASLDSGRGTIYLPLRPGSALMIEPFVTYSSRDTASVSAQVATPQSGSSIESWRLGVGVFRRLTLEDDLHLYYGGRVGALREEVESTALVVSPFPPPGQPRQETELDAYTLTPVVGLQFFPIERFSVGAEVGWEYTDGDSVTHRTNLGGSTQRTDSEFSGSESVASIVVRFFF